MVEYVSRGSNRRVVLVGDILEGITPKDKRFEYGFHLMTVTEQCQAAKKLYNPIKRKILAAGRGNHETSIRNHGDIIKDVFCKDLKIPYGTSSFKLIVNTLDEKLMYKAFANHPHSGTVRSAHPDPIMREASEMVQLKRRLSRERMADCILNIAAHYHKAITVKPHQALYLVDNGEKIKQRYIAEADQTAQYIDEDLRWYGSVPGWIRKYMLGGDGYVERAGLEPLPLGYLRTTVRGGKLVNMEKVLI
jgi:hypothetical protein